MADIQKPKCKSLILDAGPLLSLSPLRGLASTYYTTPQVLAELKDGRAREHLEKLGLLSGVKVVVKSPDAASLTNGEFSRTDVRFVDLLVCVCVCSGTMGKEDGRLFRAFTCRYMCDRVNIYAERGVQERAGREGRISGK